MSTFVASCVSEPTVGSGGELVCTTWSWHELEGWPGMESPYTTEDVAALLGGILVLWVIAYGFRRVGALFLGRG